MDWAILRTRPTTRLVRAGVLAAVALGLGADPAGAATFEVNSTGDQNDLNPGDGLCRIADPGPCTLRAAIEEANALANSPAASPDVINFEIGAGVQTISLTTGALPTVTDPVTIDGYSESGASPNTQPGFAGAFAGGGAGSNATLQIELDLNDKAGLVISGGGSTVKGLAIYGVRERIFIPGDPPTLIQSHAIELRTGSGNKVQGNFIGLSAAGTAPAFADLNKQPGVGVISGDDHTIGGTDPADRNVISANGGANGSGGIHFEGGSNSVIQGNLIGTTPDGTDIPTVLDFEGNPVDINNGQFGGIQVSGFNPGTFPIANLTIGGTAPGAGNLVSGNLHDANSGAIHIFGNWTTPEVHVLGNRVGTDVTGTAALGNITGAGIYALGTTEIGDDQGHGNLVSGNGLYGLRIDGEGHTIQGNRIGTNASGTSALPNSNGIWTRAEGMLIGGTTPLAGNLISGNDQDGITGDSYDGNDIQGNFIGTNAAGTAPVPNGFAGISVPGGVGNTIGGAAQNADNVISGNGAVGVLLTHPGEGSSATQNEVLGNKIGTNDAGTAAIQNGGPGIQAHIAGRNVLGRPSEGNVIAHNADDGVLISGTDGQFGSDVFENDGNSIRGNSIFSNGQLGIDLGEDADDPFDDGDGVTANDAADQDAGNNELQNVPVVTGALPSASTFVRGALNSRPGTTYTIDVYSTATCDSSGSGEGGRWLGQATTATNGSGDGVWSTTVAETIPAGEFVTATATDPSGNTSEFAACRESGTQTAEPDPPPPDTPVTPQQQAPVQQNPTPTPPSPSCADKKAPITTLKKAGVKNDRRGAKLVLNGRSADHRDCPSGVNRVDVSLARVAGRTGVNCRFIKKPNRTGLTRRQNCRRPVLFRATGTDRWTFTFPVRLPKGLYRVQARGTDRARNKETPKKNRNIVFFEVK